MWQTCFISFEITNSSKVVVSPTDILVFISNIFYLPILLEFGIQSLVFSRYVNHIFITWSLSNPKWRDTKIHCSNIYVNYEIYLSLQMVCRISLKANVKMCLLLNCTIVINNHSKNIIICNNTCQYYCMFEISYFLTFELYLFLK